MKKVKFNITSTTCEKCESTVKNALNKEGILKKNVSFKTGEVKVRFTEAKISKESNCNAINQTQKYKVVGVN